MTVPVFGISEIDLIIRLVLAILLGSLIGFEREIHKRPAGLRTHVLVCVGSMLFTVSSFAFPGTQDVSRIAAGIVTGIGFLGAGAIFRMKEHVEGLTTAADLWVLAAIGILLGIGFYFAAIVSTVLIFLVLVGGKRIYAMISVPINGKKK